MRSSREQKLVLNSGFSLIQQLVAIVCGLLLPRIILVSYGSSINGLVSSITQFLSFITLLQGGLGTVARVAFYRPLAEKNNYNISVAFKTVSNYFQRFSCVFLFYMIVLAFSYPLIVKSDYKFWYVFFMVIILGISSVSEYFFGQASQLILYSDQKGYMYSVIQIICTIMSTFVGAELAVNGHSILVVKLVSTIIFGVRPIVLYFVVGKIYNLDKTVKDNKNLLSQRNAALVRHIAFYIHTSTDMIVLTFATSVIWVSVYTVHRYVVNSLSTLVSTVLGNIEVVFGNILAKDEKHVMKKQVPIYDLLSKMLSSIIFFTCMSLISPFVSIYTRGVTDAEYFQPKFAILLTFAEMIYCMGIIYQNMYIAAGHIKQTQWIAVTETIINLSLSIIFVSHLGIIGVAIGTVIAMSFKTIANIIYMRRNIFNMSVRFIVSSFISNIIPEFVLVYLSINFLVEKVTNYFEFCIAGLLVLVLLSTINLLSNLLLCTYETKEIIVICKRRFSKK